MLILQDEQEILFEQIKNGISPAHSAKAVRDRLLAAGFEELDFEKKWQLAFGRTYMVMHHDTSLFAFTIGADYRRGDQIRIAAAHTDYPTLRIKPNPDFLTKGYAQVNLEVYGGPILSTWFDRPLGVAGRVVVKNSDSLLPETHLYNSTKPIMIIPSLAIHMNPEANKGTEINNQTDLMPILDALTEEQKSTEYFMNFLAEELGVKKEDILDFELNTFLMEASCLVGVADTMLSAPRLDNQTSVSALASALIKGEREDGINMIALFDHEEIGNRSKQGAASILLHDTLRRILRCLGNDEEDIDQSLYAAMMLSVDVAHALHPNKINKYDIINQPILGQGLCIKTACSQTYATDPEATAIVIALCQKFHIPYQRFVNRSDVRGGGTLGSVASTLLPIKTVDVGIPILAMHSARELMGASDIIAMKNLIEAFFRN